MDNQVYAQTNSQPEFTPSSRSSKPWLFALLAFLLVAGVAYGVYAWQHSETTKLNKQISSLQSQSTAQAAKIASLNKQLSPGGQSKTAESNTGPFDQTRAITDAVKEYKDNVANASKLTVTINGVTASGNAAYGVVRIAGADGGGGWLAINTNGKWSVVSQGAAGFCKAQMQQYNLPAAWLPGEPIC